MKYMSDPDASEIYGRLSTAAGPAGVFVCVFVCVRVHVSATNPPVSFPAFSSPSSSSRSSLLPGLYCRKPCIVRQGVSVSVSVSMSVPVSVLVSVSVSVSVFVSVFVSVSTSASASASACVSACVYVCVRVCTRVTSIALQRPLANTVTLWRTHSHICTWPPHPCVHMRIYLVLYSNHLFVVKNLLTRLMYIPKTLWKDTYITHKRDLYFSQKTYQKHWLSRDFCLCACNQTLSKETYITHKRDLIHSHKLAFFLYIPAN